MFLEKATVGVVSNAAMLEALGKNLEKVRKRLASIRKF
jgi:hypothetical protein